MQASYEAVKCQISLRRSNVFCKAAYPPLPSDVVPLIQAS